MISRSFLFNKGCLPGNISKDAKMKCKRQKTGWLSKEKKKSDASMTKTFYFGRWVTSTLIKRKRKKGALPSIICLSWISCTPAMFPLGHCKMKLTRVS